jgi:hypothetical protein
MLKKSGIAKFATIVALFTNAAVAQDRETIEFAQQLGIVLGSEGFCGLTYDQQAITKYIGEHIKPDNLEFAGWLDVYTSAARTDGRRMSASEKTARCFQVARTAKFLGFVK